jgi:hypothetical protein
MLQYKQIRVGADRYLEDRFTNYPTPPIADRDSANAVMEDPLAIQLVICFHYF